MAGRRLAVALSVAAVLSACGGGDVYFDFAIMVNNLCPNPLPIASWSLSVRQNGAEQCMRGACVPPDQPIDCVEDVQTEPIEPNDTFAVTLAFYDQMGDLVACADQSVENGVEKGDRITLMLECGGPTIARCPGHPPMSCPLQ